MNNISRNKEKNIEKASQPTNRVKNARIRLNTTKQIADAIHSQSEKNERNSSLFSN
jgi:hypothetical protein